MNKKKLIIIFIILQFKIQQAMEFPFKIQQAMEFPIKIQQAMEFSINLLHQQKKSYSPLISKIYFSGPRIKIDPKMQLNNYLKQSLILNNNESKTLQTPLLFSKKKSWKITTEEINNQKDHINLIHQTKNTNNASEILWEENNNKKERSIQELRSQNEKELEESEARCNELEEKLNQLERKLLERKLAENEEKYKEEKKIYENKILELKKEIENAKELRSKNEKELEESKAKYKNLEEQFNQLERKLAEEEKNIYENKILELKKAIENEKELRSKNKKELEESKAKYKNLEELQKQNEKELKNKEQNEKELEESQTRCKNQEEKLKELEKELLENEGKKISNKNELEEIAKKIKKAGWKRFIPWSRTSLELQELKIKKKTALDTIKKLVKEHGHGELILIDSDESFIEKLKTIICSIPKTDMLIWGTTGTVVCASAIYLYFKMGNMVAIFKLLTSFLRDINYTGGLLGTAAAGITGLGGYHFLKSGGGDEACKMIINVSLCNQCNAKCNSHTKMCGKCESISQNK